MPFFACAPAVDTLIRCVAPVATLWTNTSATPFVSPATRFDASELNVTRFPSAGEARIPLLPFPGAPVEDRLTRRVVPVTQVTDERRRRRRWCRRARDWTPTTVNATRCPSAESRPQAAQAVRLHAGGGDARALRGARQQIAHEHVGLRRLVSPEHEIRGGRVDMPRTGRSRRSRVSADGVCLDVRRRAGHGSTARTRRPAARSAHRPRAPASHGARHRDVSAAYASLHTPLDRSMIVPRSRRRISGCTHTASTEKYGADARRVPPAQNVARRAGLHLFQANCGLMRNATLPNSHVPEPKPARRLHAVGGAEPWVR